MGTKSQEVFGAQKFSKPWNLHKVVQGWGVPAVRISGLGFRVYGSGLGRYGVWGTPLLSNPQFERPSQIGLRSPFWIEAVERASDATPDVHLGMASSRF